MSLERKIAELWLPPNSDFARFDDTETMKEFSRVLSESSRDRIGFSIRRESGETG